MTFIQHYDSPLGGILLAADAVGLTGLWFDGQKYFARGLSPEREEQELPVLLEAKRWLDIYFTGKEPDFLPPLHRWLCIPAVRVGDSPANSLRKDYDLRRDRAQTRRKTEASPNVRAGHRRCGGAQ